MQNLSSNELRNLISAVFPHKNSDKKLAILVDVPDATVPDNTSWQVRRQMANAWSQVLNTVKEQLKLEAVTLIYYGNVHNNNADLPEFAVIASLDPQTVTADDLKTHRQIPFSEIFESYQIYLAPTHFSTTAPLKVNARKYGFRAATMPGFSPEMLPALKLDYDEVGRRVSLLTDLVNRAETANCEFTLDKTTPLKLDLDLRFRAG
ncbi:hypothetical protein KAH55_12825, partial [bacterium]|nr:hypothetical protein [bacterium]